MTVYIDQLALRDFEGEWGRSAVFEEQALDDACSAPFGSTPVQATSLTRATGPGTLSERRITAVLETIEQSLESGATGERLAASIGLSKGAFHRAFRATFGTTPFRYLTRRRVEAAAGLMVNTDLPLGVIAVQSGFYDQAHLCRQFRRVFGESPKHWRERHPQWHRRTHASA